LLAAVQISVAGDGILFAAAPLLAASLSSDPLVIGAITSAGFAAWLVGGLPIGVLVDRLSLARVMLTSDAIRVAVLVAFTILLVSGDPPLLVLGTVMFLLGIGSCFFDPAAQALLPDSTSKEPPELLRTNLRLWMRDSMSRWLFGPPVGAALVSSRTFLPFLFDALTFLASAALIARLPREERSRLPGNPLRNDMWEGLRVMWCNHHLRVTTIGMTLYNLGWAVANATLVLFAIEILHLTEEQFGMVLASTAAGAVLGRGAYRLLLRLEITKVYAIALLIQACGWTLVALAENVAALVTAIIMSGATNLAVSATGGTARQMSSPIGMVGRISANARFIGVGVFAVGSLLGGVTAAHCDLTCPLFLAAGILSAAALWLAVTTCPTCAPGDQYPPRGC
jgi:MFS family permease